MLQQVRTSCNKPEQSGATRNEPEITPNKWSRVKKSNVTRKIIPSEKH